MTMPSTPRDALVEMLNVPGEQLNLDLLGERLEAVGIDETVDFLIEVVFPKAKGSWPAKAGDIAILICSMDGLTVEHVRRIVAKYLEYVTDDFILLEFISQGLFDEAISLLVVAEGCDASTLGTLCRTLDRNGARNRWVLADNFAGGLIRAAGTPVEVAARMFLLTQEGHPERFWSAPDEEIVATLTSRMVDKYPDLADLPAQFVMEAVATQPIPDEWFIDAWKLPFENLRNPFHLTSSSSPWEQVVADR